jgi:two-component SAPR family response regulator
MNINSQKGRFSKVLVIDEDETEIYITNRIIRTSSFADQLVATSSISEAMDYLRQNISPGEFPDLIFLGINLSSLNGIDFMKQYSLLAEQEKLSGRIVWMRNVIGMEKSDFKKIVSHPQIKFIIEKPLTKEALQTIV